MRGHGEHDRHDEAHRHARNGLEGDVVPARGLDLDAGDGLRMAEQQRIDQAAHDDHRDQRRQEGAQPQVTDEQAVDGADRGAAGDGDGTGEPQWQAADTTQPEHHEVAEREHRADAEIDAPGQHDDGHAEAREQVLAAGVGDVADTREAEHVGDQRAEHDQREAQRQHRDGAVDPRLGEDLADEVARHEAIPPARVPVGETGGRSGRRGRAVLQAVRRHPPLCRSSSRVQQDAGARVSRSILIRGLTSATGRTACCGPACSSVLMAVFRSRTCPATL